MESWFLKSGDVETGPYSMEELLYLMTRKQLQSSDLLRQGRSGGWSSVEQVQQLKHPAKSTPKPLAQSGAHTTEYSMSSERSPVLPADSEQLVTPPPIARGFRGDDQRTAVIAGGAVIVLLLGLLIFLVQSVFPVHSDTGGGGGGGQGITGFGDSGADGSGSSGLSTAPPDLPDLSVPSGGGTTNPERKSDPPEEQPARSSVSAPAINPPSPPTPNRSRFVVDDLRELDSRLDRESAKTGDVQISLMWSNRNDVDLHVMTPSGEFINFAHRRSECRGTLDVDMNAERHSDKPVENIFWPTGQAPHGVYKVYVNLYAVKGGAVPTPFQVYVKRVGQPVEPFRSEIEPGPAILVTEFTY
jgi:hypothetical protein